MKTKLLDLKNAKNGHQKKTNTVSGWFGDSMEGCDGAEPGFAVGAGSPDMDNLPGFWFQDLKGLFECPMHYMLV